MSQYASVLECLLRLRQVCCATSLVPDGRLEQARKVLNQLAKEGPKLGKEVRVLVRFGGSSLLWKGRWSDWESVDLFFLVSVVVVVVVVVVAVGAVLLVGVGLVGVVAGCGRNGGGGVMVVVVIFCGGYGGDGDAICFVVTAVSPAAAMVAVCR